MSKKKSTAALGLLASFLLLAGSASDASAAAGHIELDGERIPSPIGCYNVPGDMGTATTLRNMTGQYVFLHYQENCAGSRTAFASGREVTQVYPGMS
ncbi:hypothetical protein, partial [Streptomyces sp. JWR5-1]